MNLGLCKVTKYFERTATRIGENSNTILAWCKGEEKFGLKNSLFICEDGVVTQYVDSEEGEKFHEMVKNLTEKEFDEICDGFFEAIENKDLAKMHEALAVFDEIDNYPELVSNDMKRRLMRVRKFTESEPYKLNSNDGMKDFIIYKGKLYNLKLIF